MARIVEFNAYAEEPNPIGMEAGELWVYLATVLKKLEGLEAQEPEDMYSQEYDTWALRYETLEDLADEIRDQLDML